MALGSPEEAASFDLLATNLVATSDRFGLVFVASNKGVLETTKLEVDIKEY